jgi:hypothetical protein
MSNILISLAAEFTGKKAFKQADTAAEKLGKSVKKLAGAFGLAFGTQQVAAFAKASVKAFADDEAAAVKLTKAVENLGLGFEDTKIKRFISDLEGSAGVADDVLRPAFQSLISTTGSVTKSQDLLSLALDIAAGTGEDAASVANELSKAYLGQTKGLIKYNTGLTKTELAASDFATIQTKLTDQYKGQNAARLDTYSGKVGALGVAYGNLQETVGGALVDSFMKLAGDTTVEDLTKSVDDLAQSLASVVELAGAVATPFVGLAKLFNDASDAYVKLLYKVTGAAYMGEVNDRIYGGIYATKYLGIEEAANAAARKKAEEEAKKRAAALAKLVNDQKKAQEKILKDKKLSAAIDKANLALNKGTDIFDMDKIQLNAAMINQAQQLGKATSASQLLMIANDVARLKIKQDIIELEDAIASKDEARITAATKQLNEDLKILGTLQNQNIKLADIKSILDSLVPKELIEQANLDEALRKIREMLALLAQVKTPTIIPPTVNPPSGNPSFIQTPNGISPTTAPRSIAEINKATEDLGGVVSVIADNGKEFIKLVDGLAPIFQAIEDSGAFNALVNSFAAGNIGSFGAGSARVGEGGSLFNSGAVGSRDINISVTTGIGDPNAIAEAVTQVIQDAVDRGTLRGGAY